MVMIVLDYIDFFLKKRDRGKYIDFKVKINGIVFY